ncbi:unnamed protein product [Rangifer tarandus platyrhynchus]|uniref:Uncharacterized protein n=1 Tax=Rangifer tarandus platyrhynchus TaxID=3082113 RepID=A0ABN8YNL7_RANTA|nr:unnamed protein product [Rangifer tarandus platyrhynchus]
MPGCDCRGGGAVGWRRELLTEAPRHQSPGLRFIPTAKRGPGAGGVGRGASPLEAGSSGPAQSSWPLPPLPGPGVRDLSECWGVCEPLPLPSGDARS